MLLSWLKESDFIHESVSFWLSWPSQATLALTGLLMLITKHGSRKRGSCEFPQSKTYSSLSSFSSSNPRFIWSEIETLFLSSPSRFSSVAQSCPTPCNPMNRSTPGLSVHHQLDRVNPEFTQTHVHWVGDAIQPSHPLASPSPPAPNPSQHQSLLQGVNSSHEVAKVLEFQL